MAKTAHAAPGRSAGGLFSDVLPWVIGLVVIAVVGGVVIVRVRRALRDPEEAPGGVGFTLHDLRTMHARGEMTDVEFRAARDAMIAGVKDAAARSANPDESA
ncbi:MAG: hypothetical protein AB8G96_06345 [Phycisphaerales bacterium]